MDSVFELVSACSFNICCSSGGSNEFLKALLGFGNFDGKWEGKEIRGQIDEKKTLI